MPLDARQLAGAEPVGELVPYVLLVRTKGLVAARNTIHGIGDAILPDGHTAALDGMIMWPQSIWVEH